MIAAIACPQVNPLGNVQSLSELWALLVSRLRETASDLCVDASARRRAAALLEPAAAYRDQCRGGALVSITVESFDSIHEFLRVSGYAALNERFASAYGPREVSRRGCTM